MLEEQEEEAEGQQLKKETIETNNIDSYGIANSANKRMKKK